MKLSLEFSDTATPLIEWVINNKPKWYESALKSAGYWAQQEIKKGIQSGSPGGRPYAPGMSVEKRRALDGDKASNKNWNNPFKNTRRRPLRNYPHMGHLVNAVKYDTSRIISGIVTVGWNSRAAVRLGSWQEKGISQPVTEKMRRMLFAAGIGLQKGKSSIDIPMRQTYAAMKPIIDTKAPLWVQDKIDSYINGNEVRSAARYRRRYKVYG